MQNDDSHGPAGFGRRQHPSLGRQTESVASGTAARAAEHPLAPEAHNEDPLGRIKIRIFGLILDTIEVSVINKLGREQARDEITALIGEIVTGKGIVISVPEQEKITQDILNDMFGLGPIEPLMDDPEITDIMVNGHKRVFIERKGRIELTAIAFRDNAQLVNEIVGLPRPRIHERVAASQLQLARDLAVELVEEIAGLDIAAS